MVRDILKSLDEEGLRFDDEPAHLTPLMAPPYLGLGPTDEAEARSDGPTLRGADPHLRSVVEVIGYRVHAVDGEIGHIENLVIDDANWSVHCFIVDTRNWWFGKCVLISPLGVKAIDWFDRRVELNISRELVKTGQPWDPLVAFVWPAPDGGVSGAWPSQNASPNSCALRRTTPIASRPVKPA
jgi:PRC-barrel domain